MAIATSLAMPFLSPVGDGDSAGIGGRCGSGDMVAIAMRVLVACEFSGVVRDAFRERGHDAWSCDLLKGLGTRNFFHYRCDITIRPDSWFREFGLMIGHPSCDRLLVSGALHWNKWQASGEQQKAIEFFLWLWNRPVEKICLENPVGIMSRVLRPPDQYIEPWQFGHPETKKTGLWLKGLPPLVPTENVHAEMMKLPPRLRNRVHHESPGVKDGLTRSQRRAIFFTGWGNAMADQWGSL